jgi:DNA-binding NarL/FixJ family response regulator
MLHSVIHNNSRFGGQVVELPSEQLHTLIIADDHPLFRTALKQTLNSLFPHNNIQEAQDITSLQHCVEQNTQADLVLLDLHMPGAHGFSGLIHLTAHYPQIPVIVVSAHETPEIIQRAMDHGAAGFLPKSSPTENIAEAIQKVLEGQLWLPPGIDLQKTQSNQEELKTANILSTLTPQQFRVATLLAQGLLNKQIAYELNVKEATIKAHITEIFKKLGVHSRTQAVLAIGQLDVQPPGGTEFTPH